MLRGVAEGLAGEQEPENDPDNETAPRRVNPAAQKPAFRVDLRNIRLAEVYRTVPAGSFDSSSRNFCDELDEQMYDALAGQI